MSNSLPPHGLQHTRLSCPSPSPGVCANSRPLSRGGIQPSHPLSPPSPLALNLSQYQGLFRWVSSLHQVAKVLEYQLQHQSFQLIFRVNFLEDWLVGSPCCPVQCSSVAQWCPTLCNPMDCSTPGLPIHHQLPEFTQTHVHWVADAIQQSHPVIPFFSCLQSFPASGSFQISQLFTSGGQSTGVSASTSVLPTNTQDWSPLGWTGWISLQSKGLSRVFSNTTVQKHQFFSAQLSL